MKLLPLLLVLLFFMPFVTAFDIGGFHIEDGNLKGKYHPSGLEGCVISCYYSDKHVLDMVYKNDSIEITFEFLSDPILKRLISRDAPLKEALERELMNKTIRITGPRTSFEYPPGGCKVELYDIPTRYLKIETDRIVIHNNEYRVRVINDKEIKLEKANFTSILMSENPITVDGENIQLTKNMIFVSFSFHDEMDKKMENAFSNRTIGGEVFLMNGKCNFVSYFGNISINFDNSSLSREKVVLYVRGDDGEGGKVIKVNIADKRGKLLVKYDGRIIDEADNIEDILNPNDDGSNPEYYKLSSEKEGTFLLISIPHFSEHKISIEFIIENPLFRIISFIAGIIVVGVAAFYLFKP